MPPPCLNLLVADPHGVGHSVVLLAAQIVQWLHDHDDLAHRIALEGQRFAAQHLSKPARLCYIRRLLTEFGSLFK
jgi:hypothetical protein